MILSDMNLKIRSGTVKCNNKILVSDSWFILGRNDMVNASVPIHKTPIMHVPKSSHMTPSIHSPDLFTPQPTCMRMKGLLGYKLQPAHSEYGMPFINERHKVIPSNFFLE